MNNNHQLSQISIEIQLEYNRIIGNTYSHRYILKELGCLWNPEGKYWEKIGYFTAEQMKQIDNIGLEINQKIISKEILVITNPIETIYKENSSLDTLIGYVKELEQVRLFNKKDGTRGHIQRFVLVDYSGCIHCISWNLIGFNNLKSDSLIAIQNYKLKTINNFFELHCSNQTKILNVSKAPRSFSKLHIKKVYNEWVNKELQSINNVKLGYYRKIKGMITDILGIYEYRRNEENQLMLIIILDDQTEAIKVSLFGEMCDQLLNLTKEEKEDILSMDPIEIIDSYFIVKKFNEIIGRYIIVKGIVEKNEYTGLLELKANRFYYSKITGGN